MLGEHLAQTSPAIVRPEAARGAGASDASFVAPGSGWALWAACGSCGGTSWS